MSFQSRYKNRQIKTWQEFYIDYDICLKILEPLNEEYHKLITKKFTKEKALQSIEDEKMNTTYLLAGFLQKTDNEFKIEEYETKILNQLEIEFGKISVFYNEFFKNRMKPSLMNIKAQMDNANRLDEFTLYEDTFEESIKELYRELKYLEDFIDLNIECKNKIVSKFTKFSYAFPEYEKNNNFSQKVDEIFKRFDDLYNSQTDLFKFGEDILLCFECYFSDKYSNKTESVLKEYVYSYELSNSQSLLLGLFLGLMIFSFFIIGLIIFNYNLDIDNDQELASVFPMFRAFWIICLYWWVTGLNVFSWNQGSINYKLIFNFGNYNCEVIEIFKSAASFTFILLVSIIFYMLYRAKIDLFSGFIIPVDILPLICWGSFFFYWFCPIRNMFDYKGRVFMFDLLSESLVSFLMKPSFRNVYTVDQISTLVGPLRDIEYTLCYYAYYDATLDQKKIHCRKSRGIFLFIAFFPNLIRIFQCIKTIIDSSKLTPQIYNVFKYSLNLVVASFSFFLSVHPMMYYLWLITSFISTCFSYVWDIKMDFGLLEKGEGYPLRKKLCYNSKLFYYSTAILNFFLRFLWLITLSPEVINQFIRPETLSIILYSLEIFRRGMWNNIRVEHKHIEISKDYRVTSDIELPFVYVNGKICQKETNLVELMGMSREDKINYEIKKLFDESEKPTIYKEKLVQEFSGFSANQNSNDLDECLKSYNQSVKENLGLIKKKVLSRKNIPY